MTVGKYNKSYWKLYCLTSVDKAATDFFFSLLVSKVPIMFRIIKSQIYFLKGKWIYRRIIGSLYKYSGTEQKLFYKQQFFRQQPNLCFYFLRTTRMLLSFWWKVTSWSTVFPKWSGQRQLWQWHLGYKKNA